MAYRGIVPRAFLDDMDIVQRTERWEKILIEFKSTTYVCADRDGIVAWISIGPSRDSDLRGLMEV